MSSSINLISTRSDDLDTKLKRLRITRIIAVICLIFVAVSAVGVFILTAQVPLASIKKDEAATLNDISYLHDKSAKLYLANDRINNIQNIISKRKNYSDTMSKILGIMPAGVNIDALTIDDKSLILSVSSTSLTSIEGFLNSYVNMANNGKVINSVSVDNLVLNPKIGRYGVSLKALIL